MSQIIASAVFACLPLLPHAGDKDGIGLRIHGLGLYRPLIAGEHIAGVPITITLINFTEQPIWHDSFVVANRAGTLTVGIHDSKGNKLTNRGISGVPPAVEPFVQQLKLGARKHTSMDFVLGQFSYRLVRYGGRFTVSADFMIDQKRYRSPELAFEAVDEKEEAVLAETPVKLGGFWRNQVPREQLRVVVQQIEVRNRKFLIYRRYNSEKDGRGISLPYPTRVLGELSEKVAVSVEGTYESSSPLTIRFRKHSSANESVLVISSISGMPWTPEEEKLFQERKKSEKP